MIINLCEELFEKNNLSEYFSSNLIADLYLKPKKISQELIDNKLSENTYINKVENTIQAYKNTDIEDLIIQRMNSFATDLLYKADYKLYVLFGLDTTTIYSTKYQFLCQFGE